MSLLYVGTSPKTIIYSATHNHPCYEIILNTVGEGIATVGGREYPFVPGSILIIPPHVPHTKRAREGFRDIYLHTDTLLPLTLHRENGEGFALDVDVDGELFRLMQMILFRWLDGNKNDVAFSLMYELLMQLLTEKCTVSQPDPAVEEVRRCLAARFNDPELSLSAILGSAGYHRDHLRRRFTAAYGVTPGEYLTDLRIENAKRLLRRRKELGLSIGEIGVMCGYYDSHYFFRVFKNRVGLSPSEYRA